MSQMGIFFPLLSSLKFNDNKKFKEYRHPLLVLPLLKTYMIFLVRFMSILLFWLMGNFSIGAVDVKLTEEEKKEVEEPYIAQAAFGHS